MLFVFFTNNLSACDVSYTSANGQITITGLTSAENTKLFDVDFNIIWECNPWDGNPCTDNETITGVAAGNYFLSAQSDQCDEWIPITIEAGTTNPETCDDGIQNQGETGIDCGGPCAPCSTDGPCDVNVSSNAGSIQVTGLTSDMNTKLFDTDFNVVFQCDPWNGNPCTCLLYTSPSPRDQRGSRMPSSA